MSGDKELWHLKAILLPEDFSSFFEERVVDFFEPGMVLELLVADEGADLVSRSSVEVGARSRWYLQGMKSVVEANEGTTDISEAVALDDYIK